MARPNFRYTHYDLKELRAGTTLEISLSSVNNVRLMTGANFQRFTELLDFKYLGGVAKKSPIRIAVPETMHWHLIIDAEGQRPGRILGQDAASAAAGNAPSQGIVIPF
ncbi:hypothetical protein M2315_002688 [Agrobacterium fabrum]|nr:hypothetical protein [Agrobacterium fabrum]